MERVTLAVAPAGLAERLRSAASAEAVLAGDAVGIGGALPEALIARCAAKVRRADEDRARFAAARAVAAVRPDDLGAAAGPLRADRVDRIDAARPLAVAGPVLTTGRHLVDPALTRVLRLGARGDHRASAQRGRQRTRHASSIAGAVAAESADAEVALTFGRASARKAGVLVQAGRTASGFDRTVGRAGVRRGGVGPTTTVGASSDPLATAVGLLYNVPWPWRARATQHPQREKHDCPSRIATPPKIFH